MSSSSEALAKYTNQAQMSSYFADRMGIISVKSYGAVGDGIEDDTDAILDALADVVVKDCKSMFFPRGVYKVDPTRISAASFTGIFIWGDNSSFSGISHPINQVGTNLSIVTTFLGLTDTPVTFAGQAGKIATVNTAEDALEFLAGYTKVELDALFDEYYTAVELDAGVLDSRYYTETELNAGQLDNRYYTETEIDADFATKQDISDLIINEFPTGTVTNAMLDNDIKAGSLAALTTTERGSFVGAINEIVSDITGVVSKAYVDAGDLENSLQLAKGLFTIQAQLAAGLNELSQMAIDAFNDNSGVDAGSSSSYTYDSDLDLFKSAGFSFTRSSSQKTITANGNARIKTNGLSKTVTASGNAQIDTAQYKIGSASGLFDGTGDYLTIADSADWNFGTGSFTIRAFIRLSALPTLGAMSTICCQYQDGNNYYRFGLYNMSGEYKLRLNIISAGVDLVQFYSSALTISTNTWYHAELTYDGTNYRLFLDGVLVGTDADTSTMPDYSGTVQIASLNNTADQTLAGWIDELEIAKGVARHTADFTPPTSALTADTYTKLLLHFEGSDASTSFTDSSVSYPPKVGTGMGYFDGTGDYLSTTDSDDWSFGTGDFTIRFWVSFIALPGSGSYSSLIGQSTDANNYWEIWLENDTGTYSLVFRVRVSSSTTIDIVRTVTPSVNTWYHVELARSGNDFKLFFDGTQLGATVTDADTIPNLTGALYIGQTPTGGGNFNGYMDELEVAKGVARHTANFTPATTPIVIDDYTVLMLHMDGTDESTTFTDTNGYTADAAMTLVSDAVTADTAPTDMYVMADEIITSGTVAYSVSRDNGSTWTAATKDTLVDVSAQPSGTSCRVKAVTSSVAADAIKLNAWAFGYK